MGHPKRSIQALSMGKLEVNLLSLEGECGLNFWAASRLQSCNVVAVHVYRCTGNDACTGN